MAGRVVLGALLAGLAMFVWGMVSHMALGLTDKVMKTIPEEASFVQVLRQNLPTPGIYLFPGMPPGFDKLSKAEQDAAMKKLIDAAPTMPHGIVVFAAPMQIMSPAQFGSQLGGDIAAAFIAALVLAMAGIASYVRRVSVVVLMGVFAACALSLPYMNWYGFPTDFTLMTFVDLALRALACGLVLAAIVKPGAR